MAKKRRKRRARARPGPPRPEQQPSPARQERKEQARKERERAIRQYRRRRLLRRAAIWGALAAAVIVVAFLIIRAQGQQEEREREAAMLARQVGCGPVDREDGQDGQQYDHVQTPPAYSTTPATFGPHSGATLPSDPNVYDQPFTPEVEFRAVHNLEHAYVILYYRQDAEGSLAQPIVDELADSVRGEAKVLMAPHPSLETGTNLALVAWNRLQECDVAENTDPGQVVQAAESFIDLFRGAGSAPEPAAA